MTLSVNRVGVACCGNCGSELESSVKLVEQVYGHLSPNHKRLAVDRLGASYHLHIEGATDAV